MPITGKFLADFASFYDAVQKAEVSLRSFETGAHKVETSLNKMVDSFSGRKIISEAELAVRAVNEIGGASKLTESEQRKLNATVTEALAKYKALGFEAPPDMLRLADATKQVERETGKIPGSLKGITSSLSGIAGAFGIAFSVGAIVSFGKSVFDSASKIHDMAEQLGISAEAVQGFGFAAEQSGSSLDAVGTAITKMNRNLAEGDKSTIKSLRAAGLQLQDIRSMKPEDAFLAIADAIQKIPDPMVQSQVAMQLFGRSAAELLPAIKEGFRGAADAADKMSEDTINELEAAQDAWDKLEKKVTIVTGNMIAHTINAVNGITGSLQKFASFVENSFKFGVGQAFTIVDATEAVGGKKDTNLGATEQQRQAFQKSQEAAEKLAKAQDDAAAAARRHGEAIRELADRLSGADLVRQMHDLDEATTRLVRQHKLDADAKERVAEAAGKLLKAGVPLTAQLFNIAFAFGELNPKVLTGALNFNEFSERVYLSIPPLEDVGALLPKVTVGLGDVLGQLPKLDLGYQFAVAKPKIADTSQALGEMSRALSELAQISGGTFSDVVRDLSSLVAAANAAEKALKGMKAATGGISLDFSATGLLDTISGLLALTAAAVQAGHALGGLLGLRTGKLGALLGTNATGRQAVIDFAELSGGFDKLHEKLLTLGAAGEALWIKLTQGTGRANPEQAARTIREINDALANAPATLPEQAGAAGFKTIAELQKMADEAVKLWEYMRDSGLYSAEAVQQAWERANAALIASGDQTAIAAKKASDEIKKLDDQIKSLTDSIANEAPEEVMGVIEQQTRAQIAALEEQRAAAQSAFEDTGAAAVDMAEQASDAFKDKFTTAAEAAASIIASDLQHTLDAADFVARLRFEYELPEGLSVPASTELQGFAGGTHGQYLDFGAGRPVMLHGRERVMTEGESAAGTINNFYITAWDGQSVETTLERYIKRPGTVQSAIRQVTT